MAKRRKILLVLVATFVVMQFFQPDRESREVAEELDFMVVSAAPEDVKLILKNSCYDCHSYQTKYPWYSYINPVSWIISQDIEMGRSHLNFSEWGNYRPKKANHKLEECYEEVNEGEMPLKSYIALHSDAELSAEQKKLLEDWFLSLNKINSEEPR